jgi:uncharacterized protein (TIGR02271 family)
VANMTSIRPGAEVRDREGVIGSVEQVTGSSDGAGNLLVVRQADGDGRYAFPIDLVSSIRQAGEQQFIQLDVTRAVLGDYAAEIAADAEREQATTPAAQASTLVGDGAQTIRVPLASEQLIATVRSTERGTIGIHKGVEAIERGTEVGVQAEDVEIEHLSPDQYDPNTPTQPDEWVIPVHEERLLIRKETVVKEYLRIRKRHTTRQVPVHETLRREYVEVSERGPDGQALQPGSIVQDAGPDQAATGAQ